MAVFKCKMCGGTLEFEAGATVGVCAYCGTKQTLPRLGDERRANLYDRANHLRRNNEFDKASALYEQILAEDPSDAETYWSLVLCRYGVEYVEDPSTHERVPTVNRTQFTPVTDDENYKSALQHADLSQRVLYAKEAEEIDAIRKGILSVSQKEEPFDVFICYKETYAQGRRTPDSVLATDLYHELTEEGFKVFFARITLEDKLGSAYEPYIFAALHSAKVMVALGTKPEYFNSVWVKNEWSRYLSLVKESGGKKVLIPAYRDMDPYDLPEEFSHLQAQDMSKLGFMQDLIRGIKKIVGVEEQKQTANETVVLNAPGAGAVISTAPLLKRAFLSLEDGDWTKADALCEQVLNLEPENADAYLAKLMAGKRVKRREELAECEDSFADDPNYQRAIRFGGEALRKELDGYLAALEKNAEIRRERRYNEAVVSMNAADNKFKFLAAADAFKKLSGYRDADELAELCRRKADEDPTERRLKELNLSRAQVSNQIHAFRSKKIIPFAVMSGVGLAVGALSLLAVFLFGLIFLILCSAKDRTAAAIVFLILAIISVLFCAAGIVAAVIGLKKMKDNQKNAEYLGYQTQYNGLSAQIIELKQYMQNEKRQLRQRK